MPVSTNPPNESTTVAGLAPILPNDATKFLSGTGAFTVPSASIALTSAHLLVGNVSNVATDVAVTGDVTITNAGVTAIGAGKVTASMMEAVAWTAYTPVWTTSGTAPTQGSASIVGSYRKFGRFVTVKGGFIFAAGSAVGTGRFRMSLPFTNVENSGLLTNFPMACGTASFYNGVSGVSLNAIVYADTATTVVFDFGTGVGQYAGLGIPYVWVTNDFFNWSYTYESTT